jgi:hypothetical protein
MTAKELMFIRRVQNEYLEKFGSKLVVDFNAMKNLPSISLKFSNTTTALDVTLAMQFLERSCKKNNTTIDNIKKKLSNASRYIKERRVMKEYSEFIYKNKWSPREAAQLIDKERTTILHHNASKNLLKTRKSK